MIAAPGAHVVVEGIALDFEHPRVGMRACDAHGLQAITSRAMAPSLRTLPFLLEIGCTTLCEIPCHVCMQYWWLWWFGGCSSTWSCCLFQRGLHASAIGLRRAAARLFLEIAALCSWPSTPDCGHALLTISSNSFAEC